MRTLHSNRLHPSRFIGEYRIKISVIIPAHNEEQFLPGGLAAIEKAKEQSPYEVETIVVLNRCTDRTSEIAEKAGARIIEEGAKNLSLIRNAGIATAEGEIIITVDADSRVHPLMLREVIAKMETGNYIGGGAMVYPERWSAGIIVTGFIAALYLAKFRVSFGTFWTTREACEAIGGFNPEFVTIEDVDFAVRLKKLGQHRDQKFGTLFRAPLVTSCRKFDKYGDWHLARDSSFIARAFTGRDQAAGDEYWYEPGR
ncbi:glycosyltransferase [Akkermansiaceae bacterium]|nr:glycosyltransferase [Akkermansiaceae bacterium]MDB4500835.1 glycosyltransferase [Akkermansiaceae bacterium]